MTEPDPITRDWYRTLDDIVRALATGREPEDVQAERHAREWAAIERRARVRWWEYVAYYANPRVFLPLLARTEWDERWGSWPHCNGQRRCWMHVSSRWCACTCRWCRVARVVRRDGV